MKSDKLVASITPESDLDKIAYEGQPAHMRMYKTGYEGWFNLLLRLNNQSTPEEFHNVQNVMHGLSNTLKKDSVLLEQNIPGPGEFTRTIIGMEEPQATGFQPFTSMPNKWQEGNELVVAKWGDGHTSPVHGHSTGYMHEEILSGKMRVNTYRITDLDSRIVRLVETIIVEPGVFVSDYAKHDETHKYKRQTLIHNFTSVGYSASLHFLPEHTRDGRDNAFNVEYFSDAYTLADEDYERIDSRQGMYLQPGDVVLVRSTNVSEYGDHWIVVTGPPIVKEHGFRVQERAIIASQAETKLLDEHKEQMGLILLKLKPQAQAAFMDFHKIVMFNGGIAFPTND